MSGLDRNQAPKTRQMAANRTALVASLDVGTSKIACMIARLRPCAPNEALRGRTHAVELIGYSQIQSRGVKSGAVVDMGEAEHSVRQAVGLAERMAKVRVESVLLSVSAGRLQGQLIEASADIKGGAVSASDMARVTSTGMRHATPPGRTVLHALPVSYSLDGVKGIRDPKGMVASQFGVDMNVITADATVARNLMLVVERCHLNVDLMSRVSPCSPTTRPISALPSSRWGQGPRPLRPIPAAASYMRRDLRSAGNTSPWILLADSAAALRTPSESRRYMAPC
jgi:cell division protein FtsA